MNSLSNSDVVNVLLKDNGGRNRRPIFVSCFFIIVFVDWSTLIGSVVVALGREFCIGPAEISSFCYWGIVLRGAKNLGTRRCVQDFLVKPQAWEDSPKIFWELLEAGCGCD